MLLSLFERVKGFLGMQPKNTEPVQPAAPYKVEPQPPMVEPVPAVAVVVEPTPTPAPEPVVTPQPAPAAEPKPKRARKNGKFAGDDKLTVEVNEAWAGGKAPAKKPKVKKETAAPKKLKVVKADKPVKKGKTSEK